MKSDEEPDGLEPEDRGDDDPESGDGDLDAADAGAPDADEPGQIILETAERLPLSRRRLADEPELTGEGTAVAGAYIGDRLIARSVVPDEWTPEADGELFSEPRNVVYIGQVRPDGTLYAQVGAVIPGEAIPHEPWQPAPDEPAILLLGVVVRLQQDRSAARSDAEEALDHFATILGRGAVPVVDKMLGGL